MGLLPMIFWFFHHQNIHGGLESDLRIRNCFVGRFTIFLEAALT